MAYFGNIPDKESRIGKVIGDLIAAMIYLAVALLALNIAYKFM